jgi:hypothetical protein
MSNPLVLLPFIEESKAFDFRDYLPISKDIPIGAITANTWKTAYELNNAAGGYIRTIFLPTNNTSFRGLRITIDGVVVFRSYGALPGGHGIADAEVIMWGVGSGGGTAFGVPNNGYLGNFRSDRLKEYPYLNATDTTNDGPCWCLLPYPLVFKSSVKVEIRSDTTTSNEANCVTIIGGMK